MKIEERPALTLDHDRHRWPGAGARAAGHAGGELENALLGGARAGVVTVGLGSNVLAPTRASTLSSSSSQESWRKPVADGVLAAGGGAANGAVCLHRARAAGLEGFEFACAIPGTAGGVWMNAGAYGRDWAAVLVRALVATADGTGWLTPDELGLSYRHSELRHGQVVARVEYRLEPRPEAEIKAEVADLVARRKATQPTNKRTFGRSSRTRRGVGAGRLLERCGLKGFRSAERSYPRSTRTSSRTRAGDDGRLPSVMAECRRRARDEHGVALEHEVVLLGGSSYRRRSSGCRAELREHGRRGTR